MFNGVYEREVFSRDKDPYVCMRSSPAAAAPIAQCPIFILYLSKKQNLEMLYVTIVLFAAVFVGFIYFTVFYVIEPLVLLLLNRPLYVHFYLNPQKLPPSMQSVLRKQVVFYQGLTPRQQRHFEHRVSRFLKRYTFHTNDGLLLTDEMRVKVASTYVKLTFGFRYYLFPVFDRVILYPGIYKSTVSGEYHKGEFNPGIKSVVFSWEHYLQGYESASDKVNLGIHEFAHVVHCHASRRQDTISNRFENHLRRLMKEVSHGPNTEILMKSGYFREYAYSNPFEFFAVLLEHFFEDAAQFQQKFPELYKRLSMMLNLDPLKAQAAHH
jgi:Mlc titration factor MtfA (ptsG expression regulator)